MKKLELVLIGLIIGISVLFPTARVSASSSSVSLPSSIVPRTSMPCQTTCYSVVVGSSISGIGVPVAFLAGLQARTQPQVYLLQHDGSCNMGSGPTMDVCWLNYIRSSYNIGSPQLVTEDFILQHYESLVSHGGKVLYVEYSTSSKSALQLDLARTIASADTAIPVSTSAIGAVQSALGASNLQLDVNVNNLSCMHSSDAYLACSQWLWQNYGPETGKTSKDVFATACGGDFLSTDYYAFTNAFEFVLESQCTQKLSSSAESWVKSTLLPYYGSTSPSYEMHTIAVGYTGLGGEVPTATLLSEYQIFYVVMESDLNLSFMAGLPEATNLMQPASDYQVPTYNTNEVYVTISYSQGNGIMWFQYRYIGPFSGADTQDTVANWQINGMMAQIAPPIIKYWYAQQYSADAGQYFVSANSGSASYVHPEEIPNEAYWAKEFATPYSCATDQPISFIQTNGVTTGSGGTSVLQTYANEMSNGLENIVLWQHPSNGNPTGSAPSWSTGNNPQFTVLSNGVSVAFPDWWIKYGSFSNANALQEANAIKKIVAEHHQQFVYLVVNVNAPPLSWIRQVMMDLNGGSYSGRYMDVNLYQYFRIYDQANGIAPHTAICE
jgi:GxGYxY sequence motif in domain of unknown function N-terminal/GxGYxYP putative glycoside hydrolase C-terminal domain